MGITRRQFIKGAAALAALAVVPVRVARGALPPPGPPPPLPQFWSVSSWANHRCFSTVYTGSYVAGTIRQAPGGGLVLGFNHHRGCYVEVGDYRYPMDCGTPEDVERYLEERIRQDVLDEGYHAVLMPDGQHWTWTWHGIRALRRLNGPGWQPAPEVLPGQLQPLQLGNLQPL